MLVCSDEECRELFVETAHGLQSMGKPQPESQSMVDAGSVCACLNCGHASWEHFETGAYEDWQCQFCSCRHLTLPTTESPVVSRLPLARTRTEAERAAYGLGMLVGGSLFWVTIGFIVYRLLHD